MDHANNDAVRKDDDGLTHIPAHLRVKVLHADKSILVIHKPCHLRSVPGHATPPPASEHLRPTKRPKTTQQDNDETMDTTTTNTDQRRTAQEAWVAAIESLAQEEEHTWAATLLGDTSEVSQHQVQRCLQRLAESNNPSSVPRKWNVFWRYIKRSRNRLLDETTDDSLNVIARQVYDLIESRHWPLLNRPEPTPHQDSAWGQLVLLGYSTTRNKDCSNQNKGIYVVHRLDCETSGVMVFARTEHAASLLCQAWRERKKVEKLYLARVSSWPPFQIKQEVEGSIDLPLAPSAERIKWEVRTDGGKPSVTKWKVIRRRQDKNDPVLLELTPVTGRTHQLRIHCAAVGSGICGDSLYGNNRIEWKAGDETTSDSPTLNLHAHKLSFPHPETGERVQFVSPSPW